MILSVSHAIFFDSVLISNLIERTSKVYLLKRRAEKELEKEQRKLERTNFLADLKKNLVGMEAPSEILGDSAMDMEAGNLLEKLTKKRKERELFEEENFTRLNRNKKDKKEARKLDLLRKRGGGGASGVESLHSIANMRDFETLW